MPKPSPCAELHDTWGPTDAPPLLGLKSALLFGVGALVLLFSLAT